MALQSLWQIGVQGLIGPCVGDSRVYFVGGAHEEVWGEKGLRHLDFSLLVAGPNQKLHFEVDNARNLSKLRGIGSGGRTKPRRVSAKLPRFPSGNSQTLEASGLEGNGGSQKSSSIPR